MRKAYSTDHWFSHVVLGNSIREHEMIARLKKETPEMISVSFERMCNLQCSHCIYPKSASSEKISHDVRLSELVIAGVRQLRGESPRLLHEGRILRPWHIEVLCAARAVRPEICIGLIDNGTYLQCEKTFMQSKMIFDWLDISIDGPERIHNVQRGNEKAFSVAIRGLERAREFTRPVGQGGRVTALMTVTKTNHDSIMETADYLFSRELIDQFHVTTISPARKELMGLEQQNFLDFWRGCQDVYLRYGRGINGIQRIFFRFYRHQELLKLGHVVGLKKLAKAIEETARLAPGELSFCIDGIPFLYAPLSLWPQETFLIDADGCYRTAYSIGYKLDDLQRGYNAEGEELGGYTIEQLVPDYNLKKLYHRCVDQWWAFKGKKYFM